MTRVTAIAPHSLGADLERRRLAYRAERLRRAISALEDRRLYREAVDGEVPPALRAAIRGFREELEDVERRLADGRLGAPVPA